MIEQCDDKILPNILFLFEHKDREKFLAKLLYDNLREFTLCHFLIRKLLRFKWKFP